MGYIEKLEPNPQEGLFQRDWKGILVHAFLLLEELNFSNPETNPTNLILASVNSEWFLKAVFQPRMQQENTGLPDFNDPEKETAIFKVIKAAPPKTILIKWILFSSSRTKES